MSDFKTNKAYLFQYRKKMEKIQRLEDEQQRNELLKDGEGDEGDEDWWRNDE